MRIFWISLCCLQLLDFAAASLRHRGTVAEQRAALRGAAARHGRQEPVDEYMPSLPAVNDLSKMSMSMKPLTGSELPAGLDMQSPESVANVVGYEIPMPTPQPAPFNGVFCRGGACQYQVVPPPPLPPTPFPVTPPPLPIGGSQVNAMEFCRGLTCLGGMGFPSDPVLAGFNLNCMHLYNDIGGGMIGDDTSRSIADAYQSFANVCKSRVGPLEVGACPAYANVIIGAESPKVNEATVGSTIEVCTDTYWFIVGFKQAEIDLKLTKAALPKEYSGKSLLSISLNRFGTGGPGPSSPRGLKWREWVYKRRMWQGQSPTIPQQLGADGGFATAAFLQADAAPTTPKPPIPGADKDDDTPRGLPKYRQNVPCDIKAQHDVPQAATKYQIAPGSPDGVVGPTEIDGDLFTYCANQFSEIMMGFAQTADQIVSMTKGWCAWQASVTNWVGKQDEFGHPDWNHRTCTNMQNFMGFALRDDLANKKGGLSAQQVCKKVFLSIGAVHRHETLVKEAWVPQSTRGAPVGGGVPAGDDPGMKDLLKQAQEYTNKIFTAMRKQKTAFDDLNGMKMDTAAFDADTIAVAPAAPAPDLPDSDDIDPTALISLSVDRVRQSGRVGVTMSDGLHSWGHAE